MPFRFLLTLMWLFSFASKMQASDWTESFPPHRIVGNVYYVGSRGLASFLITTPQGHILINSNLASSAPQIRESIGKLGFRLEDVKILLISHAHVDHAGGSALLKEWSHAQYMVMDADVQSIQDGGRSDFRYAHSADMWFTPVKVDRVLHDNDRVELGSAVLTAHKTAGHTKGCTTWTMRVKEGARSYNVVFVGSTSVNPGYKLVHNAQYPEIAKDYEATFRTLRSVPCDVFLGAHGSYYDMEAKYARSLHGAKDVFVDPAGYEKYLRSSEDAFRQDLERQSEHKVKGR